MTEGSVVATYFGLQAMLAIATRSLWLLVLRTYGAWVVGLPHDCKECFGYTWQAYGLLSVPHEVLWV